MQADKEQRLAELALIWSAISPDAQELMLRVGRTYLALRATATGGTATAIDTVVLEQTLQYLKQALVVKRSDHAGSAPPPPSPSPSSEIH